MKSISSDTSRNPVIKARVGRQDDDAETRQLEHVFEMNGGKRCLPGYQDQRPALLDRDVGGAVDQVVAAAHRDRCQGAHAAGQTTMASATDEPLAGGAVH